MFIYDFEYDGLTLSDFNCVVCTFETKGLQTITSGSKISFNTTPIHNGAKFNLIKSEYTDCFETTFQICKNNCIEQNAEITFDEYRDLVSWLNRRGFHKFKILNKDYPDAFFEASFNVSRIVIDNKTYGLELNLITNRPYALHEPITIEINNVSANGTKDIYDESDDDSYTYPDIKITIQETGNLNIHNSIEDRNMYIANCTAGEIITLKYPIIQSSLNSHQIQNDFNWNFLRLCNTYKERKNTLTISLPCKIEMSYSPVVKISF